MTALPARAQAPLSSGRTFSVAENATVVGTVVAANTDESDEITRYAITGGVDRALFSIVSGTGALSFKDAPNYEDPLDADTDNRYVVDVEARSGEGDLEMTATQLVTVTVTNVDEPPSAPTAPTISAITASGFTVSWTEPANTGPAILDYTVRHRVASGGTWQRQTGISGTSLALTGLKGWTDYEVQVRARNAEGRSNWSPTATATTTAAPNAAPTFSSEATFSVAENATVVGPVVAADADESDEITGYAITGGVDRALFSIVSGTGALSFKSAPNYEDPLDADTDNRYVVEVEARSGEGDLEMTATQLVTVTVTNVDEPPSAPTALTISAITASGFTVSWTEPANTGPAILDYTVRHRVAVGGTWQRQTGVSGTSFALTGLTGVTDYRVQVRARNAEGRSNWSPRATATTTAAPNAAPTFSSEATFSVAENSTAVGTVAATDADERDEITGYAITGGADQALFSMDAGTGVLAFASAPNFEAPGDAGTNNEYVVEVEARSGPGERELMSTQTVTVTVTDVAEPPDAPGVPTILAITATGFTVSWVAASNTGPAISGYAVQYREGTSGTWTDAGHTGTGPSVTLTGLTAGTSYQVRVQATNAEGTGAWSVPATGTTTVAASEACTADSPAVAGIDGTGIVADCNILLGLMDDLTGTASLNWSADAAMANWDGVAVASGRVVSLDLDSRKLSGEIPSELGGLTKLVELILSRNGLSGEIPSELGGLTKLEYLHLNSNRLSGEIPSELGGLANLTSLDLVGNELSGEIPSELGGLTVLERLWLLGNGLSGEIPSELGRLANLTSLDLGGNGLSGEIPSELGGLTNLRRLHLYSNRLSGEIPPELGDLTVLEQLHLYSNRLSGEIPSELGGLANLTSLHLGSNGLSGEIPSELGGLANLRVLYLNSNGLSGEIPSELGGLAKLSLLNLHSNGLSGEIPSELGGLTVLEQLRLSSNELSGEIPSELGGLAKLLDLRLRDNKLSGCIPSTLIRFIEAVSLQKDGARLAECGGLAANAAPTFSSAEAFSVEENATTVGTVTAADADASDSITGYALTGGADRALFSIDSGTGALAFARAPDFENPADAGTDNAYLVEVTATGGTDTRALTATQAVTVTVTDVAEPPDAPGGPTISAITATGFTVSWVAASNTGPAITGYAVQYREGTSGTWTDAGHTGTGPSVTLTGLTAGTSYQVRVQATNAEGTGAWSVPATGTTTVAASEACTADSPAVAGIDGTGIVADCNTLLGLTDDLAGTASLNWSADTAMANWDGVWVRSGRVTTLSFREYGLSGEIPSELGGLANLQRLNLSGNQLSGEIPSELGGLANLLWLHLYGNQLSGEIPSELGGLANLQQLSLHGNQLSGEIPSELGGLANLQQLSLDRNQLSGGIPPELGGLANLILLYLYGNQLSGEIPSELGGLANLERLNLRENQLSGGIPPELGGLANLTILSLNSNELSGEIPPELGGLISLRSLYLNRNKLSGCIPSTLIPFKETVTLQQDGARLAECGGPAANAAPTFSSAEAFSVEENATTVGTVTAADADASDSITGYALTGGADRALFSIDSGTGALAFARAPDFENPADAGTDNAYLVEVTATGGTDTRALTVTQAVTVTVTDVAEPPDAPGVPTISAITATGFTVSWVAASNTGPAITGYAVQYREGTSGTWTDAGHTGTGPSVTLTGLTAGTSYQVRVQATNAEGTGAWSVPATGTTTVAASEACTADSPAVAGIDGTGIVADCNTLLGLTDDLAGTASLNWSADTAMANWDGVWVRSGRVTTLSFREYGLSGEIPSELGGLANLQRLNLSGNQLSGEIPSELGGLANLLWLHLYGNQLSGEIPSELGGLANLQQLSLHGNQLSGEIPSELGGLANLQYLSLDRNQLSGGIPPELGGLANLILLYLYGNQLSGEIPSELGGLANLERLNLRENQLSGGIPPELGGLANLTILSLNSNELSGEIPPELGGLISLRSLYLNRNKLSGCIPSTLIPFKETVTLQQDGARLAECGGPAANAAPTFSSAEAFSVEENATTVGTVTAADADASDSITGYALTGGADRALFSIDSGTGALAFARAPDFENPADAGTDNAYLVEVTATGGTDTRALTVTQAVTVTVTDVAEPPDAPGVPTISAITATGFTVSWVAASNTGPAITGYAVQYREGTSGTWTDAGHTGTGPSVTLTGLTAGTSYQVRVQATNAEGTGAWSVQATGTTTVAASEACTADSPAVAGIDGTGIVADCNTLVGLMDDLAGTASLNWSADAAMANWDGVAVASGRVVSLDLDSRKLSGRIPRELGGLTKLVELILSRNGLSGEIPSELGGLTKLEYLHLNSNRLSGEIPSELGGLANLTSLDLVGNELSGEIPSELGGLTVLERLWLLGNGLSGEIPSELGGLANLTSLDLGGNVLSGEIPSELGGLANLTSLHLYSNRLSGEIPSELGGLTVLEQLHLYSNRLSGEIPSELGGLANLTSLHLGSNGLSGEIPSELEGLANLRVLYLNSNGLSGEIPSELGGLAKLSLLNLNSNGLSGEIPFELGGLTVLEQLRLGSNELSGEIPFELGGLTKLLDLRLRDNKLSGCIPSTLIRFKETVTLQQDGARLAECVETLTEASDGSPETGASDGSPDDPAGFRKPRRRGYKRSDAQPNRTWDDPSEN